MRERLDIILNLPAVSDFGNMCFFGNNKLCVADNAGRKSVEVRALNKRIRMERLRATAIGSHQFRCRADDIIIRPCAASDHRDVWQSRCARQRKFVLGLNCWINSPIKILPTRSFAISKNSSRFPKEGYRGAKSSMLSPLESAARTYSESVQDCKCEFLRSIPSYFMNVISMILTELNRHRFVCKFNISYYPHRWCRWINICIPHHEFFENIILDRPGEFVGAHALFFTGNNKTS